MSYVKKFVDDALLYAVDSYNKPASPLLADAYNKETKQHFRQDYGKNNESPDVVYSNMAHQMNFMRILEGLSSIYGNKKYKKIFADCYNFYVKHFQSENGLFYWGGHSMIDLKTLTKAGEATHELKIDYPAYQSLIKINKDKTVKYIEAFWNAHVYNWETLETSRHGDYKLKMGKLWDNEFGDPEPFIEVKGLSFINTGSDLIFAACEYYKETGNEKALEWAKRLENMYYKSRDKDTGLGVYQFNQPKARDFTSDFSITTSSYGDRAKRQLGPELGEKCLEGNMLLQRHARTIYGSANLVFLHEARTLGASSKVGEIFLQNCRSGLESFYKHAYIPETNMLRPLLADGQDLTGFVLQRDGYYGKKGTMFSQYQADGLFLLVFSKAAVMTNSGILWQGAEQIANAMGFGDIKEGKLNYGMESTCPHSLFAFLNLYLYTQNKAYLDMADKISQNIASKEDDQLHENTVDDYIWLNSLEPLAVLCCEAAKLNKLDMVDASVYI